MQQDYISVHTGDGGVRPRRIYQTRNIDMQRDIADIKTSDLNLEPDQISSGRLISSRRSVEVSTGRMVRELRMGDGLFVRLAVFRASF
jgi:hypothetical protein